MSSTKTQVKGSGKDAVAVLNDGNEMPLFGLGTWRSDPGQVSEAVFQALTKYGYKAIDCALVYRNEHEVGEGLARAFAAGVKREDVFVTSKLWGTHHSPEMVEKGLRYTLKQLQLDYLDLYLVHWPTAFKPVAPEQGDDQRFPAAADHPKGEDGKFLLDADATHASTWKALEAVVGKGLVKSIGVCNFNQTELEALLASATIPPAVLQIEHHPYVAQVQAPLIEYARAQGVQPQGYCPLANASADPKVPSGLRDPVVLELADKYGKTPGQILIRFSLDKGLVTIPKTVTPSRLAENIDVFDFALSAEDVARVAARNDEVHQRFCNPPFRGGDQPTFEL